MSGGDSKEDVSSFDTVLSRLGILTKQLASLHQTEVDILRSEVEQLRAVRQHSQISTDLREVSLQLRPHGSQLSSAAEDRKSVLSIAAGDRRSVLSTGPWFNISDVTVFDDEDTNEVPFERKLSDPIISPNQAGTYTVASPASDTKIQVGANGHLTLEDVSFEFTPLTERHGRKFANFGAGRSHSERSYGTRSRCTEQASCAGVNSTSLTSIRSSFASAQAIPDKERLSKGSNFDDRKRTSRDLPACERSLASSRNTCNAKGFRLRDWCLQNYAWADTALGDLHTATVLDACCRKPPSSWLQSSSLGRFAHNVTQRPNQCRLSYRTKNALADGVPSRSSGCQALMTHPSSKYRIAWGVTCLSLLAIDSIFIPIDLCFELKDNTVTNTWALCVCIFWSVDIVFSFFTGVYVDGDRVRMEPKFVVSYYLRTWFGVDLFIVGSEWLLFWAGFGHSSPLRLLRSYRWVRLLRLLRLLRIAQATKKLKGLIRDLIVLSAEGLNVTSFIMKATMYLLMGSHLWACFLHLLGKALDAGWVRSSEMESLDVMHRYLLCLKWVFTRLQGGNQSIQLRSVAEQTFDVATLLLCYIFTAFYIGVITHCHIVCADSSAARIQNIAVQYVRRHGISSQVSLRMKRYLSAHRIQGAGEVLEEEKLLLQSLPVALQEDLQYEARKNLICLLRLYQDMDFLTPRAVRHLCHEAFAEILAVESETVFDCGDACGQMFFSMTGEFRYKADELVLEATPRIIPRVKHDHCVDKIRHGHPLCEACVWTHWNNYGELSAVCDSVLLAIDARKFGAVIVQHKSACVHALKYAKHFICRINDAVCSDVMGFGLDMNDILHDWHRGTAENHFIFISHFKEEAGTEASLMRDALIGMINADPSNPAREYMSPVFVDSEDLTDLATVVKHVEGSQALVLLLTPGLLTRPWCLLEIVTAMAADVKVIPVEVQRPGMKYQFPDDQFYEHLRNGNVVSKQGIQLLANAGVELTDVEEAIRHVFLKIALPFSPHKSNTVRQAELLDIMKRSFNDGDYHAPADWGLTTSCTRSFSVYTPSAFQS